MDLELLFDDLFLIKFVIVCIGKLLFDSIECISYYSYKLFIFIFFMEEKEIKELWCLYLIFNEYKCEIDNLFILLYFECVYIFDFVYGILENV